MPACGELSSLSKIPTRASPATGSPGCARPGSWSTLGLAPSEAVEINAGFLTRQRLGRPLVTLKLATSLDGRIATGSGESQWITGPPARARGHALRAAHDAIMVGTATVLADDPQLTCRLPGLGQRSPVRVVLDRQLRIPRSAAVIADARQTPTWILTLRSADAARRAPLLAAGATLIDVDPDSEDRIDLVAALAALGERGVTRLLIEGGARLAAALLRARLVDRLAWFHAPLLIGGDGIPAVAALGLDRLADAPGFERLSVARVGDDMLTTFRARA